MSTNKNQKENTVEDFLDAETERRGGFTVKLNPKGYKGIQDRLVVLPGRIILVETKRPRGGVIARLQVWWRDRFADLGHEAYIVKNKKEVLQVLDGTFVPS